MTDERVTQQQALLPCPFCGGAATWCDCGNCHQLQCPTCGWQIDNNGPEAFQDHNELADLRAVMAKLWNRRAQQGEAVGHLIAWTWSEEPTYFHGPLRVGGSVPGREGCVSVTPLYASPPSDSGVSPLAGEASPSSEGSLRRALLALADDLETCIAVAYSEYSEGQRTGFTKAVKRLRALAGQGTPSVGSSGEVSPDTELVERVARSIYENGPRPPGPPPLPWGRVNDWTRQQMLATARAALIGVSP